MDAYPRSTTWPYVVIVLGLFGLAWSAPERWFDAADWRLLARHDAAHARSSTGSSVRFAANRRERTGSHSHASSEPHAARFTSGPTSPGVLSTRVAVQATPEFTGATTLDHTATFANSPHATSVPASSDKNASPRPTAPAATAEPPTATTAPSASSGNATSNPATSTVETSAPSTESTANVMPQAASEPEISTSDLHQVESSLPSTELAAPAPPAAPSTNGSFAQGDWPACRTLREQLDELAPKSAQMASWRADVLRELDTLASLPTIDDGQSTESLDRLDQLIRVTDRLESYAEPQTIVTLRRVAYGLERRLAIWRAAVRLAQQQSQFDHRVDVAQSMPVLVETAQWLTEQSNGATWHGYLMVDRLKKIASETWVTNPETRREAAREVLKRMAPSTLTPEQRTFLEQEKMVTFREEMKRWAIQPIDLPLLVYTLEQFEEVHSASLAEEIREQVHSLGYSPHAAAKPLAATIESHYRNANLRLVLSGKLLNDLLPVLEPIQQEVRDTVLGAEVRGHNQTWTDLHLRLVEDQERLHLRLEAQGRTKSRTVSSKGPVRLVMRDESNFLADKELLVSADGIEMTAATSVASGHSKLVDLKTEFDEVPILGWIVRQLARDQHDESRPQVRAHVDQRINSQARGQLDETVQTRLSSVENKFDQSVLEPLRKLNLDPRAIEMRTTPDQLIMRCRLAGPEQLAAYTPRPRALANSVLSLQVHESAPNNLIQQLRLENQRIELEELMKRMSEKLHLERQDIHEEIPEGVVLRLGSERPIEFEFDNDRVLITVRITELKTPRRTWRNFIVRGKYLPCIGQTYVDLQREGGIELISEQLGFRDQVALRGIFTKVMSRNHRLNILRGRFENDARLANLGVTQFEARDGWIGISVGPQRRPRVAAETAPTTR